MTAAPAPFRPVDMCPEHRAEWLRWLDHRLPPAPIRLVQIGKSAGRVSRVDEWRDTITRQQGLVLDSCRRHSREP